MYLVLVKFKGEPDPRLFKVDHVSGSERLATMDDVQWVTRPFNEEGQMLAEAKDLIFSDNIGEKIVLPILPLEGHAYMKQMQKHIAEQFVADYTQYDQPGRDDE